MNLIIKIILFGVIILNSLSLKGYDDDSYEEASFFGLKAGINYSTLNGEKSGMQYNESTLIDPTSKLGGTFGAIGIYSFSRQFSMQTEVLFSVKGVNYDASEYVQTWSFWYVEVPILFKSNFEMQNNADGSVYVGPAIGYLLKATWSDAINDVYLHEDVELSGFESMDYSAVIGASYEMDVWDNTMGFDLRYIWGLSSIQKNISAQNGTISLSMYYVFK